jgi:hypothetical protein
MLRLLTIFGLLYVSSACSSPSPPLPPLLQNATTTGGVIDLCEPKTFKPGSEGTTPDTVSHSPEIVARLNRDFPAGSSSDYLKTALLQMGFSMIPCPGSLAARFDQTGGNGITSMRASAVIIWKADAEGRILWTTGDIGYTGL